ncbi:ubiquinol-cytochrome-c reductase complex assembly factor 2-like [Dysidea avara]|uniref:ubiquinol-cytochrome-c reductase complex assembly factor 2-like n=1 Tax=Dysidea avara TaxID=196820 RepID=UPI0033289959
MALRDRLAKVVRRWPDEATRKGDDLGSFLRKLYGLKATSIQSEGAVVSLERISTNYYRKKYRREDETSYTGMSQHLHMHNPWTPPRNTWNSSWRAELLEQNAKEEQKWYQRILLWRRK